jgi:hypothetical protein
MPAYAGMTRGNKYWQCIYEMDSSTAQRKSVSRLQNRMIRRNNAFPRAKLGTAYRNWPRYIDEATGRAQHRGAALTAMQGGNTFNVIGL